MTRKKITLAELYELLYDHLNSNGWWPARTDWQIVWGAVLIQNTNWKNVDYALANLKQATDFLPANLRRLSNQELEQIIRSAGFYVRKAQTIKNLCDYFATYHDNLAQLRMKPAAELRQELLALSGIGHETADVILLYVLSKETFIVDVYARRLFDHLGIVLPKTYDAAQELVMPDLTLFTLRSLQELHACIVLTGQTFKTEQDWQNNFLTPYQLQLGPRRGE
ncbi:endonuclease III domain-containing protein [Lapidilactobacillus bayanensis]|uniref:endonuclease III domain-containing protein n=1 Tax=Lapidilactobacillus bayanensis TaxID=2485998 RepID=UPI000F791082|nr:endonuclease III [Lapidilactobacillus bayanensis]